MPTAKTSTTERALRILYHCAAQQAGSSFSELRSVGGDLASMTLSRILNTLLEQGDLSKDLETGLYLCGPRFLRAARAAVGQVQLEDVLQPIVEGLARRSGCSAAYFHWDRDCIYIRLKCELPENFHYTNIGGRHHPLGHTFYRSIQSALSAKQLDGIGVRGVDALLAEIREQGYFTQHEDYRIPIYRVTAPVFYGGNHQLAGAIGITALVPDLKESEKDALIAAVCDSAQQANTQLASMEYIA